MDKNRADHFIRALYVKTVDSKLLWDLILANTSDADYLNEKVNNYKSPTFVDWNKDVYRTLIKDNLFIYLMDTNYGYLMMLINNINNSATFILDDFQTALSVLHNVLHEKHKGESKTTESMVDSFINDYFTGV